MKCEILLFAQLADAVGKRRIDIEVPLGWTVGDVMDRLAEEHAAIAQMRGRLSIAVDERYEREDRPLEEGSVVALIPPVSGG